jgi:ABC-type nickel/cobalt efflux system permease component RcnA
MILFVELMALFKNHELAEENWSSSLATGLRLCVAKIMILQQIFKDQGFRWKEFCL